MTRAKGYQGTQKTMNKVYKSEFHHQKNGQAKKRDVHAAIFCFHAMENNHLLEDTSWNRLQLGHPGCFILYKRICEGNPEKLLGFLNSFDTGLEWQQKPIRMWSQLFLGEISPTFGWQAHLRLFSYSYFVSDVQIEKSSLLLYRFPLQMHPTMGLGLGYRYVIYFNQLITAL